MYGLGLIDDTNFLADIEKSADQMNLFSSGQDYSISAGSYDKDTFNSGPNIGIHTFGIH